MSGFARQVERAGMRVMYNKFSQAFRREKAYQELLLKNGEQLPEGQRKLGKKPPFGLWMKAVKKQREEFVAKALEDLKASQSAENVDLEWEEAKAEEAPKVGDPTTQSV